MIVKRDFRRSGHFSVRGEFHEWILSNLKFKVPCLEVLESNMVPKPIGDLAGTLKAIEEPLKLHVSGHGPHVLLYCVAPFLLPGLLGLSSNQTTFELPPHRDTLSVFKQIIPLYGISFKVDGSDVYHRSLQGPMIMEVAFRLRKPSRRVSIFPSREVHPYA
ncbi:hypothetical protein B296_00021262 [Ensete ventricosum]|uniref:Uncharacterized protein n=1 Tax=Ensete ventricosum TaxID=4639 RepID=A0A426Y7C9_ENSVE|nr:hypothetical protein B296_00021262 [Ensete ventricosum]